MLYLLTLQNILNFSPIQNLTNIKDVNILVNIVRAFDIPVRDDVVRSNHSLDVRQTISHMSTATSNSEQRAGYNAATTEIKVRFYHYCNIDELLLMPICFPCYKPTN